MDLRKIAEGHRNHLFPPEKLKEIIKETSEYRLGICIGCEFNSTHGKIKMFSRCTECGCPLIQKSKSLSSNCPINKWSAVDGEANSEKGTTMETPGGNPDNG